MELRRLRSTLRGIVSGKRNDGGAYGHRICGRMAAARGAVTSRGPRPSQARWPKLRKMGLNGTVHSASKSGIVGSGHPLPGIGLEGES